MSEIEKEAERMFIEALIKRTYASVILPKDDYEKLKKLDENVRKLIEEQKEVYSPWVGILESLYND